MDCFPVIQEYYQNNDHADNSEIDKFKIVPVGWAKSHCLMRVWSTPTENTWRTLFIGSHPDWKLSIDMLRISATVKFNFESSIDLDNAHLDLYVWMGQIGCVSQSHNNKCHHCYMILNVHKKKPQVTWNLKPDNS